MYIVVDHKLAQAHPFVYSNTLFFRPTDNFTPYRTITPNLIVMHYTAGASAASSADWCCNPSSKVSYHLIIDRDGSIIQLVPFHLRAWHAGNSAFGGRIDCNSYSIGIALANFGMLYRDQNGSLRSSDRIGAPTLSRSTPVFSAFHKSSNQSVTNNSPLWEAFTVKQIFTLRLVLSALISYYPITAIVGHDDVSPGRKIDPGPAFPPLPVLLPAKEPHVLLTPSHTFPTLSPASSVPPFFFCSSCSLSFDPKSIDDYPDPAHAAPVLDFPRPQYCPLCGTRLCFFS